MAHWLLKTEPSTYSIDDLAAAGVDHWDGVRNPWATMHLKTMVVGEQCFFYHSSCQPPGIAGICEVVRRAYPDHTAFDEGSKYFDPKSDPGNPRWWMPDVKFVEKFPRLVTLTEMRTTPGLNDMVLLRRGMRLSVQPVTDKEWDIILELVR